MKDAINPSHYKSECSLECYQAMIMVLGVEGFIHFCLGNAFKYMWRHKNKGKPKEDLEKSNWYLNKAIEYGLDNDDLLAKAYEMKDLLANLYSMAITESKVMGEHIEECIDKANGCSMENCPIDASTFKTCKLSENECEYYTSNDAQEGFLNDWEAIRHWLTRCKRDGASDYYINKMWDIVQSRIDIIKSDKFSYTPEKRYIIHDYSYDLPGYEPVVKDVCIIVEIDENGRPYYSIRYVSKDNLCHVGYSSYKLKTVLLFLKDYFICKED